MVGITEEVERRGSHVTDKGLVVYTAGCLQQEIRIAVYDRLAYLQIEEDVRTEGRITQLMSKNPTVCGLNPNPD